MQANDDGDDANGAFAQRFTDIGIDAAGGHVFVLVAVASTKAAGFDAADRILADITNVINTRYWDDEVGLLRDEYTHDWRPFSEYRGYNSNMHGTEAFLAAYEATGDKSYLNKAGRILDFFTGRIAPKYDWRLPEHFTPDWKVDLTYEGNPMFRRRGTTPGHTFELARPLLQHWDLTGRPDTRAPECARRLVETALRDAWVAQGGGFAYTLDYGGAVQVADRYWWPVTEAIGVLATMLKLDGSSGDEARYRRVWQVASDTFMDHERGGWFPEVDAEGRPVDKQFAGRPDIYHALQADLLPLCQDLSHAISSLSDRKPLA